MISEFKFKGISSRQFDMLISSPPALGAPQRVVERVAVNGRSGTLEMDGNRYEDRLCSYEVGFKTRYRQVPYDSTAIKAWLYPDRGFYELTDTYDPDYYWKASFSGPLTIEDVLQRGARLTINFVCHPFKYSYIGQSTFTLDEPGKMVNPEAFECRPYFKIFGSGAGELYVGNQTISISNIDEYLELDSEVEQAFKASENKNSTVVLSDFPIFRKGETDIQWAGGIERIEIVPRWCTL